MFYKSAIGRYGASFIIVALCSFMCLLSSLMLLATLNTASYTLFCVIGYMGVIFFVWSSIDLFASVKGFDSGKELFVLMVICFILHLAVIQFLPTLGQNAMAQGIDSMRAYQALACGKICLTHGSAYPHGCNYEIVLSMLGVIFGKNICVGQILNALCCVMAFPPLYRMASEVSNRRMARFAVLVMGFSPTLIGYPCICTGEFISSTLLFYAAYFLSKALRKGENFYCRSNSVSARRSERIWRRRSTTERIGMFSYLS